MKPAAAACPPEIERAARHIHQASALMIAAGSGIGVDSGLPDFRGRQGFWRAYPALQRVGIEFQAMAQPASFRSRPALAWGFYGHRLNLYRSTVPHEGFGVLRRWAEAMPEGARVFTSNVDGQFQRAGFPPEEVAECHGTLLRLQCARPCSDHVWSAEDLAVQVDADACIAAEPLPRCPHCGALARPNLLMFHDAQWLGEAHDARCAAVEAWAARRARRLVVVEIGAGTAIPSVRHFSERVAQVHEAALVRINPGEPQVPAGGPRGGHQGLAMGALEALQQLDAALARLKGDG